MTVHDLAYERGLVPMGPRARIALAQRQMSVARADGIIFISEATRLEFAECYPRHTGVPSVVAWHGRDPDFDTPVEPADHGGPYLLHVGHRDGYKNFGRALRAYAASSLARQGIAFVCVGPKFTGAESAEISSLGLREHVRWVDAPTRRQLQRWLTGAIALVYVSMYEGFGMPLVEAMQCGTAVIAADSTCLPEVGGDVPIYVDPLDVEEIAAAMTAIVTDDELRATRVALGHQREGQFEWATSAELHAGLYERLGAGSSS